MAVMAPLSSSRGTTGSDRATLAAHDATVRLAAASLIGLAAMTFLVGTAWDIQWHPSVGRDRALTSPHLMMLGGIALAGLISLVVILLDSWRAWRGPAVDDKNSIVLLGLFRAPIGLILSGFGALLAAVAFPLDDYWHTLYGIDVTLWAPFHVMIITSMLMVGLGVLYLLASEMNRLAAGRTRLLAQLGFAAMLAVTFAILLLLLPQANVKEGLADIGGYTFVLYPILLAFALPLALISVVRVTRLPGAATIVALVFLALRYGLFLFVPWAMDLAVAAEGFAYRPNGPQEIITPYAYPGAIVFAALAVDAAVWVARRRGSNADRALFASGAIASVLVTFWDKPWAKTMTAYFFPDLDVGAMLLHSLPFTIAAALLGAGAAALFSRGLTTVRR